MRDALHPRWVYSTCLTWLSLNIHTQVFLYWLTAFRGGSPLKTLALGAPSSKSLGQDCAYSSSSSTLGCSLLPVCLCPLNLLNYIDWLQVMSSSSALAWKQVESFACLAYSSVFFSTLPPNFCRIFSSVSHTPLLPFYLSHLVSVEKVHVVWMPGNGVRRFRSTIYIISFVTVCLYGVVVCLMLVGE